LFCCIFFFAAILWSFGANSKQFQEVFAASQSPQLVLTFGHQLRPPNSQKIGALGWSLGSNNRSALAAHYCMQIVKTL